jgi:hypothetical protein
LPVTLTEIAFSSKPALPLNKLQFKVTIAQWIEARSAEFGTLRPNPHSHFVRTPVIRGVLLPAKMNGGLKKTQMTTSTEPKVSNRLGLLMNKFI